MPERRWLIPLAFAAIYVIWGSTYLAIRFAIETLPPFLMAGGRFLVAGLVLYAWSRWRGAGRPSAAQWRSSAILGTLLLVGGNGLVSWAELRVPSGIAALLVSTVPLFVVLLEWRGPRAIRVGRPRLPVAVGVVSGLLGIAVLIGPGELLGKPVDTLGAVVLIVAALTWSIGSTISRKLEHHPSPVASTSMQMLTGGGILIVAGLALGESSGFDVAAVSSTSLWAFVYLIVFGSIVAFTAYVFLLSRVAVAKVSTYAYVNPVVALLLGWALASEPLGMRTLLASAIILGAVFLITTQRRAPKSTSEPTDPETAESPAALERSACRPCVTADAS